MEFRKEFVEVAANELPLKRSRGRFVMLLEAEETILELGEGTEVVRGEHLALDNGEIDLDLVEPAGVNRSMDRDEGGPMLRQAGDAPLSAVGGTLSMIQNRRRAER